MSNQVKITMWGVRGSTPCANAENIIFGGNTTCLQLDADSLDELLIVDCGTGFRNLGNHLVKNGGKGCKGRVFITHPHWDHLQGFPFFKPFYDEKSWFRVYLPPQMDSGCKEILQGHMSDTFFPVTIDMLEADMECETFFPGKINFEQYSVEYMWAKHTVQTAIFKFRFSDKTIVIAPDNELPLDDTKSSKEFLKEFKSFIKGADLLIHDAQFDIKQHRERQGWGHSAWENVIDIVSQTDVKKLCLTHHDPDSSDDYLAVLDKKVRADDSLPFDQIFFAKEGQEIILP